MSQLLEKVSAVKIVSIGARRYRQFEFAPPSGARRPRGVFQAAISSSSRAFKDEMNEEPVDMDAPLLDIQVDLASGDKVYKTRIGTALHGSIIGRGGAKLQKLQTETGCRVILPKRNSRSEVIELRAAQEKSIISAKTQLDLIVESALNHGKFTKEVLAKYSGGSTGIDPSVFVSSAKLHLTCFVMKLYSEEMIKHAMSVIEQSSAEVYDLLGSTTLLLGLKGIDIMNDDPTAADVVYAKVADSVGLAKLNKVCDVMLNKFHEKGLISNAEMKSHRDRAPAASATKWHATLINTKYRKPDKEKAKDVADSVDEKSNDAQSKQSRNKRWNKQRENVDVSGVLKEFGTMDFGVDRVPALHLSEMTRVDPDGFYHCVAKIPFP